MLCFHNLALGGAFLASLALAQSHPADTADQQYLNRLATKLHGQNPYEDLKEEVRQRYISVVEQHGYNSGTPLLQRVLDQTVEELAFSWMQKAVNDNSVHPKVYWVLNPPHSSVPGGRYAYDNPETIYRFVPIDCTYNYIIHGQRYPSGVQDATFSLVSSAVTLEPVGGLNNEDLVINLEGTYAITINSTAATSTTTNHIQCTDDAAQLFIRHNIADWSTQTADILEVELVSNDPDLHPDPCSESVIIQKARDYFKAGIQLYTDTFLGNWTFSNPQNVISAPVQSSTIGNLTRASAFAHYNLSDLEAIVITMDEGPATYWVLTSYSLWAITGRPGQWLESQNSEQAVPNEDGTFTLVLSTVDPGVYNWINATESGAGTFMTRFQGPLLENGESLVRMSSQVVPLDQLNDILPKNTKQISTEERQAQVNERAKGYARFHGM